jgi:hypothetical protein
VMVVLVFLEVLRQMGDPLLEEGDLDLRRAGIGPVEPVLGDRGSFVRHASVFLCGSSAGRR